MQDMTWVKVYLKIHTQKLCQMRKECRKTRAFRKYSYLAWYLTFYDYCKKYNLQMFVQIEHQINEIDNINLYLSSVTSPTCNSE